MRLLHKLAFLVAVVAVAVNGNPVTQPEASVADETGHIVPKIISIKELRNWIRTTKGEFKFIGEKFDLEDNPLASRDTEFTTVTFCSNRDGGDCNPPCTTFSGSNACLSTPNTNCLVATTDVLFCGSPGCGGICNSFNSCGTRLNNNFCFTPSTQSIRVP
ncbi:hypothetical protein PC9H_010096 [Pleurotus ostreatus]|uniref:Uncharacterized protein n=1 Tax=Pleurotus ostreatus TaxID=5322 RepID=A0A8H6ZMY5_PLEOS|nr:uncharacterized protein PC9H_010096 [Pleurotus ostreatus]KAF7424785.1 hypothetical protein PC9H_010096 [Pleurotus ostreatus]KAJ8692205.1 hypothetical protein PTI98_009540 [Pleurotus ostreatus]